MPECAARGVGNAGVSPETISIRAGSARRQAQPRSGWQDCLVADTRCSQVPVSLADKPFKQHPRFLLLSLAALLDMAGRVANWASSYFGNVKES